MSKAGSATAKERRTTYKDYHYCGPSFTFPSEDAEDIGNAVSRLNTTKRAVGPIKACLIARAKAIGATDVLPDTWKTDDTAKMSAWFSLPEGWSYGDLRTFLESELQEDFGDGKETFGIWVTDIYDDTVIYHDTDGSLKKRAYAIVDNDAKWGDPEEVVARTSYEPVTQSADHHLSDQRTQDAPKGTYAISAFALADQPGSDGNWVIRRGPVFEAGDYPAQQFSATPDDLYLAALDFEPVKNRVSHMNGKGRTPTIFDDHMGELTAVELSDDGGTLIGTIRIPKWLDDFQQSERGGGPMQASLELSHATKRIVGNTLIPNPQVESSALLAAFSRTDEGKRLVGDAVAFAGKRNSGSDQETLNQMHDTVSGMLGGCGDDGGMAAMAGARLSAADRTHLQTVHDTLVALGAACPEKKGTANMTATTITSEEQAQAVSVWQAIKAVFTGSDPANPPKQAAGEQAAGGRQQAAAFSAGDDPTVKALQAEVAQLKADKVAMLAAAFADDFIGQKRALPAERASMMALFAQAYADDAAHPSLVFFGTNADGTDRTGSRVEALRATYQAKAPHMLTEELLRDNPALSSDELRVVFAAGAAPTDATQPTPEGKQPTPERIAALKRHIPGAAD